MLLLNPSVKILTELNGDYILKFIEQAGRTCYKSECKATSESHITFAKMLLGRQHESVLEHFNVSVRIVCDRGVSHEIVRHRLASYSQESTRYCNYTKNGDIQFIIPPWVTLTEGTYDEAAVDALAHMPGYGWLTAMKQAEKSYQHLISIGWKPEQARSVLPNSLKTELVMTCNLREWRHFFKMRTAPAAHPQMRQIALPMLREFSSCVPVVFEDLLQKVEEKSNG